MAPHHAVTPAEPLRAAGRARGAGARCVAVAVLVWALTPHLSQLRLLLPPGVGAAAARRARADLHRLRRADPASALRRARRAAGAGLRRERGPRRWCSSACSRTRRWCSAPTGSARRSSGAGAARWRALFVAASASFLLYAARGYVDAPFLALVVWAGVLEAEGRGPGAVALLVAAGLLRPEAWVLGGLLLAVAAVARSPRRRCG